MQTGVTGLKIAKFNILYMCISLLLIDLFSWKMVLQNMQKLLFEKLKTQFSPGGFAPLDPPPGHCPGPHQGPIIGGPWTLACF